MKDLVKNNITILVAYYNIPEKYFRDCMNSLLKLNTPILIVNDGSSEEYKKIVNSYASEHVDIIHQENSGQAVATLNGLNHIKTKYVVRVDSDDILLSIPSSEVHFDFLNTRNRIKTFIEYAMIGTSFNGSVFDVKFMKWLYKDAKYISEISEWIHEDVYAYITYFIFKEKFPEKNKYIEIYSSENNYRRVFRENSTSLNKNSRRVHFMMQTLMLFMMKNSEYFSREDYIKYDIALRGYNEQFLKNKLLSREIVEEAKKLYEQSTGKIWRNVSFNEPFN